MTKTFWDSVTNLKITLPGIIPPVTLLTELIILFPMCAIPTLIQQYISARTNSKMLSGVLLLTVRFFRLLQSGRLASVLLNFAKIPCMQSIHLLHCSDINLMHRISGQEMPYRYSKVIQKTGAPQIL